MNIYNFEPNEYIYAMLAAYSYGVTLGFLLGIVKFMYFYFLDRRK